MRVVFDTNVIVDAIAARQPFGLEAEELLLMVSENKMEGFLTANSVTDIYYVIRRNLSEDKAREIIRYILYSLDIAVVSGEDCWDALNYPLKDFEDSLVAVCAEKIKADCIISRDDAFLKAEIPVKVFSPAEFLASFGEK